MLILVRDVRGHLLGVNNLADGGLHLIVPVKGCLRFEVGTFER